MDDYGVSAKRRREASQEPGCVLHKETEAPTRRSKDVRGWRAKIGVLVPSTNTIVEPDFEDLRAALGRNSGVTNHVGRILIPNIDIGDNEGFSKLQKIIPLELDAAADRCMTAVIDHLAMGMSAPTFYHGYENCMKKRSALAERCGMQPSLASSFISSGSFACELALKKFGCTKIAVLSPYAQVGDVEVTRFFTEAGFDVVGFKGLRCRTPIAIAEVPEEDIAQHLRELDGPKVEALVQVGTNLSFIAGAASLERELKKPVLAINTVTYWQALRALGINDKICGFGRVFEEF